MVSNKKIITTHKAVPPTGHSLLKLNIIMKKSLYLFLFIATCYRSHCQVTGTEVFCNPGLLFTIPRDYPKRLCDRHQADRR